MSTDTRSEDGESFDSWQIAQHYLKPIRDLLTLDGVSEICVTRWDQIYIERYGALELVHASFESEEMLAQAIIQIGNALNQPADHARNPVLDARLRDGSRVCGVLFPTSTRGSTLSIRVFPKQRLTADGLVKRGSLSAEMLEYLRIAVIGRANMLVAGGTASGKTTLLNVLSSYIPKDERVITVEDTQELQIDIPHLVCLEAPHRKRESEKRSQHIDMAALIRTTLRLRPSRLVVGEIRDLNAAIAFLHAINTGHSGTSATIHANSPRDALTRLETLVAGGAGGLPFEVVRAQTRSNLDVLIQAESTPHQGRRVVEIAELREGEVFTLWSWDYVQGAHRQNAEHLANSAILQRARTHGIKSYLLEGLNPKK